MKRYGEDLVMAAFGAMSSLATAVVLWGIESASGFSLYTWTVWFIIPLGALLAGAAAATGYYLGARLFNHRPSPVLLVTMAAISVGTFFLIYYLSYSTLEVDGQPIRSLMPFGAFLQAALTHSSLTFRLHATKLATTPELGAWGYLFAMLQILGFALGGLSVYYYLSALPFCSTCNKYLKPQGKEERTTRDSERLASFLDQTSQLLAGGHLAEVLKLHSQFGDISEGGLRTQLSLWHCPSCMRNLLRLTVSTRMGQQWIEKPELQREAFTTDALTL